MSLESFPTSHYNQTESECDVLVVGAGPVGLTTATKLAEANPDLRIQVHDRREQEERDGSRAFVVHGRTLEYLTPSGITEELEAQGRWVTAFNLYGRYGDAESAAAKVDFTGLDTRYNKALLIAQPLTEAALRGYAYQLELPIHYGHEFTGFDTPEPGDNYIKVQSKRADGQNVTTHARYVVGADGSRSPVRSAIGLNLEGEELRQHIFLGDVRLDNPPEPGIYGSGADGTFGFLAPYSENYLRQQNEGTLWRLIAESRGIDASTPITSKLRQEVFEKAFGTHFGMNNEPVWTSRFDVREGLAPSYRGEGVFDRVLLVGDAGHTHSPAGGQGMNLGIGDAANLAWRLGSVAGYGADPHLLDAYTTERRPVAAEVLKSSNIILKLAKGGGLVQRIRVPALQAALSVPPIRKKVTGQLSGIGIQYRGERGDHALVGTRVRPDTPMFEGERSLFDLQAAKMGGFVLAHSAQAQSPDISGYEDRITVAQTIDEAAPTMLIRPDGHVAWAEEHNTRQQLATFGSALLRVCGVASA